MSCVGRERLREEEWRDLALAVAGIEKRAACPPFITGLLAAVGNDDRKADISEQAL
jgi:hypothetical protein